MLPADPNDPGPAGDGRFAAVLRDDVAGAAAAVRTSGGHEERTYDLTGPQHLALSEAAELMSRPSGREIRYHEEADQETVASRAGSARPTSRCTVGPLLPGHWRREP